MLLLTCGLAFLCALYGVPIARQAALKYGIVDAPDGRLKHQKEPVPYFGGLAIYLAFLMSLAFTFEFRQEVLGIVLGGTIVVMLGLIDDFGVLTPWTKLAGQLLAVFVLIKSGIRIEIAAFPEWLDLVLTVPVFPGANLMDFDHHSAVFEASYQWCGRQIDELAGQENPALAAILATNP